MTQIKTSGKGTRTIRVNGHHMTLRLRYETLLKKYNMALDKITQEQLARLDDHILAERHVNLLESVIPEGFYPEEPFIGRLIMLLRERGGHQAELSKVWEKNASLEDRLKASQTALKVYKTACLAGETDLRTDLRG